MSVSGPWQGPTIPLKTGVGKNPAGSDAKLSGFNGQTELAIRAVRLRSEGAGCGVNAPDTPASTEGPTPLHGRNELFRVTSTRRRIPEADFWASLPSSAKAHLILSALAAASVVAYCSQQFAVGEELVHVLIAELLSAAFFVWFAIDAVNHENAFELLAQAAVATCTGARIIYFAATTGLPAAQIAVSVIALILLVSSNCAALVSYSQFGWRMYSKIACDLRAKDGKSKQKTFLLVHVFLTLLKLDTLLLLILFAAGLAAGVDTSVASKRILLLAANPLGLVASGLWCMAIFFTVRNDWSAWEMPLMALLPVSFAMPAIDIIVEITARQQTNPRSRTGVLLAAAVFTVFRSVVAVLVQVLVSRFRFLHVKHLRTLSDSTAVGKRASDEAPPGLAPLIKGAWIGKPSPGAPKKRRFFQLSSDGSALRWAWDKYILLYYVEAQENSDKNLEILLRMVMEPDLRLKFDSPAQYRVWRDGLEATIRMLEQPASALGGSDADAEALGEASAMPHGMLKVLLLESRLPGKYTIKHAFRRAMRKLSGRTAQRRSEQDPKLKHFFAARQRAVDLHALGVRPAQSQPASTASVEAPAAVPASRHKRGSTVPSIQEIVDAIAKDSSPERQPSDLQRQMSFGKKCRELVIDCISPNTRQVRLSSRAGSASPGGRPATRVLFGDGAAGTGPPSPPGRSPSASEFQIGTSVWGAAEQAPVGSPAAVASGPRAPPKAPTSRSFGRLESLRSGHSEAIDSQECLDTVGPLPTQSSRPASAGVLKGAVSPSKLLGPAVGDNLAAALAAPALDGGPPRERVEVVIHEPAADARWDAFRRSSGEPSSSAVALHPLIQRTRTTSSSGSFYGLSPIQSQSNSGNYTSEISQSYSTSVRSQATISSSISMYSNGPIKMSVPFVPIHEIAVGRCLGEGSEGVVYAGSYLETPVAIKQLSHVQEMEMNLHIGSHDNVVALRGISKRDDNLILVMEYCPKATLHLLLHGRAQSELDGYKLVSWVRAIARGMLHLHTRTPPILHRDLKPANIFVGHGFVMKIGDFGMSRHVALARRPDGSTGLLRQLSSGVIGTAAYAAPELLEGEVFADDLDMTPAHVETILKSDVYSFGVTLWEMVTRKHPFSDMEPYQINHAWMAEPQDMQLPAIQVPPDLSPRASRNLGELAALARDCTAHDPAARPSFHEVCLRLKHLPPRSSSVLGSPVGSEGAGFRSQPGPSA